MKKNPYTKKDYTKENPDELMHIETKEGKENKLLSL